MALQPRQDNSRALASAATAVALIVLTVHISVATVVGANGWDDGTITLAFARTFADSGQIAVTHLSETVEGFSSPLWFLLMAVMRRTTGANFEQLIFASQVWAGICSSVGAVLLFILARRHTSWVIAGTFSVTIFVSAGFLNETMNGMEMTALATLATAVCLLLDGHEDSFRWLLLASGAIAPWIRLESTAYILIGALALFFLSRYTKSALAIAVGTISSFFALTLVRLLIFGELIPNTMLAKRWLPYSSLSTSGQILSSTKAALEIAYLALPFVGMLALAFLGMRRSFKPLVRELAAATRGRTLDPLASFGLGYVLAATVFNIVIGKNWGYLGRMELSIVPVLGALTFLSIGRFDERRKWALVSGAILLIVLSAPLVLQLKNLNVALGRDTLGAVTPAYYRQTGIAYESVRTALGRTSLDVMTPDIGGASLCCNDLRIVDSAMLANRELAEKGYAKFDSYLEHTRPDVIETHAVWAQVSDIYNSHFFRENYVPIVVDETWLYVRNDDFEALRSVCSPLAAGATKGLRYRGNSDDEKYVNSLGRTAFCRLH